MADRYLLESGAPDGYLLEDGSGVYLLNNGVVWDTAASHADYTINDTGLITTKAANAVNGSQAQANTVKATGYFETKATPNAPAVGLVPSGAANNNWVGFVANSIGYHSGGTVYRNNVNFTTYAAFGTTDTVMCALKLVGATLYVFFGVNGVWQTGTDPSAGTGGIDVTALFASAAPAISANNINDATTGHFTAADLTYAIPTGLTAWDGTTSSTILIAVGLCAETNTALGLGIAQGIGLSSGTNTAIALSGKLVGVTGLATGTNTSLALAAVLSKVAGLSTGTNTALALGLAQAVGLSIETDTPFALSAKLIKAVGLGTETDTSLALAMGGLPVGISAETETALARPAVLVSSVGISLGTNLALGLGLARPPGTCTEVETNYALTPLEAGMVGFAVETDTVLALVPRLIGTVGRSNEIDLALRLPLFRAGAGDSRFISTFAKSFAR